MKTKYEMFVTILMAIMVFLTGCKTSPPAEVGNLKLVAKYKPLHLYIYADTASTNKYPDYAIFQRNTPIVIANNNSNTVEISFWEKDNHGDLRTTYDLDGHILKRSLGVYNDDSTQTNYLYFDNNADGLWDGFVIDEEKTGSVKMYNRSNLCWALRVPNQQK